MRLQRGIIVSCQAAKGEPLYGYHIMHLFAKAVVEGGAVGIRALAEELPAIKQTVSVPVIGLVKQTYPDSEIYITPTKADVDTVLSTGCDVVALDATSRPRPNGENLEELVAYVRTHAPNVELMADIATVDDARKAVDLGFDYVSTTLRGYTEETKETRIPDFPFIREVKKVLKDSKTELIVEGGVTECKDLRRIKRLDPYAVVIGSAITRPMLITQRFVSAYTEE